MYYCRDGREDKNWEGKGTGIFVLVPRHHRREVKNGRRGGRSGTTSRMDAAAILPLFLKKVLPQFLPSWVQRSDSEIEEGMKENFCQTCP